jgi:FAD/FMN-containing dehydrogenase
VIDLKHFQHFSMDRESWLATVGGGTLLGDLTKRMHDAGNRAMPHGTCPQVGLGGHATIGGLGPSSRLWGAALDQIVEMEVVLADSSITRCSEAQNPDIFWALKGAGASFGVVTEFVLKTQPEPGEAVQFSYSFTAGKYTSMAGTFKAWQKFVSDPKLTRRFASEVIFTEIGMIVSGTYFGTKAEYDAFDMDSKFPGNQDKKTVVFKDWVGLVGHWGEEIALRLGGGISGPLFTKSLTFNGCYLIPDAAIDNICAYMDRTRKGTVVWFVIFDLAGGAVNDIPQDATAYAHRDALFYMQSYAVGLRKVSKYTKSFLRGLNALVTASIPGGKDFGAYAGYVDPELVNGPLEYWRTNLPRLELIKSHVDPRDVFHNPQSVPLASSTNGSVSDKKRKRESYGSFASFGSFGSFYRKLRK